METPSGSRTNSSEPEVAASIKEVSQYAAEDMVGRFFRAVRVWVLKPHALNRQSCGARVRCSLRLTDRTQLDGILATVAEAYRRGTGITDASLTDEQRTSCSVFDGWTDRCVDDDESTGQVVWLCVRDVLPKAPESHPTHREIVVFDGVAKSVFFYHLNEVGNVEQESLKSLYYLTLQPEESTVSISFNMDDETKCGTFSKSWMKKSLLEKITQWTISQKEHFSRGPSLQLIEVEKYNSVYRKLKKLYAKDIIENWTESTDPLKFVHEDLAIAAYLLCLWKNDGKQSFVDLGCGNGLLVYVLCREGHIGYGTDVRRRKIWDIFAPYATLKEETFSPAALNSFPDIDWFIGNHSDELTPWMPFIAARSSRRARFFVLPCCAFELSGRKYQRRRHAESVYSEYLDHVTNLATDVCGFRVRRDVLRIPSTKRVCLVAVDRQGDPEDTLSRIDDYMQREGRSFIARSSQIPVTRNCTQIDKNVISLVVDRLATTLIQREKENKNPMALADVAKMFEPSILKELKAQCGGLQTMARNHKHIFSVRQGAVSLQTMEHLRKSGTDVDARWKTKQCWFDEHHPDGCPLEAAECRYAHRTEPGMQSLQ